MVKFGIFWQLGAGDVMLKYWDVVVTMVSLLLSACKLCIEHIDAGSWKINLRLKVLKVHDPEFVIL